MSVNNFPGAMANYPAKGIPGMRADMNPVVYTDRNYIASDATIRVGNFVWETNAIDDGDYHGSGMWYAASTGTGLPLGFVEHWLGYPNYDIKFHSSLLATQYAPLQIVKHGCYYATATTAATKGQKVFATLTDGSIQTGAAGATIAGTVETWFSVGEGGAAGSVITINSWTPTVA